MLSLKDVIEKHSTVVILGFILAVATPTYFITKALSHSELLQRENRINTLEAYLASIDRGIESARFLDVGRMLISGSKPDSAVTEQEYFGDWGFYAPRMSEVDHRLSTVCELYRELRGVVCTDLDSTWDATNKIHVWRWGNVRRIEGTPIYSRVFPNVIVYRANIDDLFVMGRLDSAGDVRLNPNDTTGMSRLRLRVRDEAISRLFVEDLSGLYDQEGQVGQSNFGFRLLSVDKKDNALYSRYQFRFENISVDEQIKPEYFVTIEEILLSDGPILWRISTMIPSDDPARASRDQAILNQWLSKLRIMKAVPGF